jgi:hypothetical protein
MPESTELHEWTELGFSFIKIHLSFLTVGSVREEILVVLEIGR